MHGAWSVPGRWEPLYTDREAVRLPSAATSYMQRVVAGVEGLLAIAVATAAIRYVGSILGSQRGADLISTLVWMWAVCENTFEIE